MDAQKESEAFERFKAEKIGIAYEELKVDLDDCERRFGKRYAGWNFSDDWEVWQAAKASVAEGFVLVPREPTKDALIEISSVCIGDDYANLDEAKELYMAAIKEPIEAQETSND